MIVATEPLKRGDLPLPRGLHLQSSHTTYNCGSQRNHVSLYNTKDQPVIIKKGTPVGHMVAANVTRHFRGIGQTRGDDTLQLTIEERREKLFKKLDLS